MSASWPRSLRKYLITGLLVWLPVVVTVYVLWWGFKFFDSVLGNAITRFIGMRIPGIGILTSLVLIFFTGLFAANYLGRRLIAFGDNLMTRIPLVRSVYLTVKQIVDAFLHGSNVAFQQVVLVEYPRPGMWAIAFMTSDVKNEIHEKTNEDIIAVFIPTTPNPTSGFLLYVPKQDVIFADMSVEDGLKMVVSGGIVTPNNRHAKNANGGRK